MCTPNQELSLYQLGLCGLLLQLHNKLTQVQTDRRLAWKIERKYSDDIFESFPISKEYPNIDRIVNSYFSIEDIFTESVLNAH